VGRFVSGSASPAGRVRTISGPGAQPEDPAVAYAPAPDKYLVVWRDRKDYWTVGDEIWGRRMAGKGRPLGQDLSVSDEPSPWDAYSPAVAYGAAAGRFLVVWRDDRNAPVPFDRGQDIFGRRVAVSGKMAGAAFRISGNGALEDEHLPAVVYGAASARFLVVWSDGRKPTRGDDVFGRRVSG